MLNRFVQAMLIVFSFATYTHANAQQFSALHQQSVSTQTRMLYWESSQLKSLLQDRIAENQHLIKFLKDYGQELGATEVDASFDYTVKQLLDDQQGLLFISEHLANVDTSEGLKLDEYLLQSPRLNSEVEKTLAMRLSTDSGRALVHRVLYYSLMDKYVAR